MLRELLSRGQFLEIIGGRNLKFTAADQVIRLRQFREGLHFRPRPAGPPDCNSGSSVTLPVTIL